jgi:adenine-specific DNA-methyltransferase
MPTLNWIGKEAVVDHHRLVPTRLLECNPELSFGDPDSQNLLVEGDNLEALKALLPRYRGQVKCIYIDPPYNTGNENWVYNDNVNDPRIKKWLGQVVGKEAEDLCRHDKWLCMMYPRLALLREFLCNDGAIFVSIDDTEVGHLRLILDEIFGVQNFIANVIWQKKYTIANDSKWLAENHDHLLVYAKDKIIWRPNRLARTEEMNQRYRNPDNHPKGPWKSTPLYAKRTPSEEEREFIFTFKNGYVWKPPAGTTPRFPRETLREMDASDEIWFGSKGDSNPSRKTFLSELKIERPPSATIWSHSDAGHNHEAREEIKALLTTDSFDTPKPVRLIERVLQIATDKDSLILDSFAGSGTTGHAVMATNVTDKGNRKCILIEVVPAVAEQVTAVRLKRASQGYVSPKGKHVTGLGSGFRYCKLGRTLLDEFGDINGEVPFTDLARYVYLLETGVPVPKRSKKDCPLLGIHQGRAIYLLYNGVLGDRHPAGGNVLTNNVLAALPPHPEGKGSRIIFGEATRLSESTLARENIVFRQIPYSLRDS